jgi:hypothetical protein
VRCEKLPKKLAAKNAKERCKYGQGMKFCALSSNIRCVSNSRRLQESVQRITLELWPDKWILDSDKVHAHDA